MVKKESPACGGDGRRPCDRREPDYMRICDLKEKEVINICDGERLGYVEDVEFDLCTGRITHIIVPGPCKFFGVLGREEEFVIEICNICKIGCDLILVEVYLDKVRKKCC